MGGLKLDGLFQTSELLGDCEGNELIQGHAFALGNIGCPTVDRNREPQREGLSRVSHVLLPLGHSARSAARKELNRLLPSTSHSGNTTIQDELLRPLPQKTSDALGVGKPLRHPSWFNCTRDFLARERSKLRACQKKLFAPDAQRAFGTRCRACAQEAIMRSSLQELFQASFRSRGASDVIRGQRQTVCCVCPPMPEHGQRS